MNVAVDNVDGNPEVLVREEKLLAGVTLFISRQDDHAQLGLKGGGVNVPVKIGLVGVRLRESLHALKGILVEDQGQVESLGY